MTDFTTVERCRRWGVSVVVYTRLSSSELLCWESSSRLRSAGSPSRSALQLGFEATRWQCVCVCVLCCVCPHVQETPDDV